MPNARTKMLDEGWATYCHVRIMRRLFQEGLLTPEEHDVFNKFHSGVVQDQKIRFNVYRNGLALFEYIEDRWNKGRFGREYDECTDPRKRAQWDTHAMQGKEKIFQVRSIYSDRAAVEEFFTDEFIRDMRLYVYEATQDRITGETIYKIVEDRPEVMRYTLRRMFVSHGVEPIAVVDSNFENRHELYLTHEHDGLDLEPKYARGTLENIRYLWGRRVHLETIADEKPVVHTYNGKEHKQREVK